MTDFLTSDHHFQHKNINRLAGRPFSSVEEMNEALITGWNMDVRPGDTVYHVGDLSFDYEYYPELRKRLKGNIKLIPGNHDPYHPIHRQWKKAKSDLERLGFEVLDGGDLTLNIGRGTYSVCHFPPLDIEDPPYNLRYREHRPVSTEYPRICGHVHEKWRERKVPGKPKVINVSVEMWYYRPVSLGILQYLFNQGW